MATLEEVVVIPESQHYHHSTESRSGLRLVIGVVVLALVPGLLTGGLFGMMIDEAIFHVKDLPPVKAVGLDKCYITLLFSTLFFHFVTISTLIGIGLGYGAYSVLISIIGPQAKATAFSAAAPAALLGITVCGAATGAFCVLVYELNVSVYYLVVVFIFLLCCVSTYNIEDFLPIFAFFFISGLSVFYCTPYAVLFMFFFGVPGLCFHFFVLVSVVYLYASIILEKFNLQLSFVPTVFPKLLLIFTLLFFVGIGTSTLATAEKETVVIVLAAQLFEAALGHLVYLQVGGRGGEGAWKVCLSAVPSGGAVLGAIQKASFLLNTETILGGLFGVSGAAGVALSAAGELGQRYGDKINQTWGGNLGRSAAIVGAAAGAFLTGGTKDFSYGYFKAVCAAMIPGIPFVEYILNVFYHGLEYVYTRTVMKFQGQ